MNTEPQQAAPPDAATVSELRRVVTGMQDALTDEMVTRLADVVSGGAGLLDQLQRSGAGEAMAQLAAMHKNGDLARVAAIARLFAAAQDAATDEMITRLSDLVSGALKLLDGLNRAGLDGLPAALPRLMDTLDRLEQQHVVDDLVHCLGEAGTLAAAAPPASGGLKGMWTLMRERESQEALRFLLLIASQFRTCRSDRQQPVPPGAAPGRGA